MLPDPSVYDPPASDSRDEYEPDEFDLEIQDSFAPLGFRPEKELEARRLVCVGITTRKRGLRLGEREIGFMYETETGHGIKHFLMTKEKCIRLANRLLEIADVEVLDD